MTPRESLGHFTLAFGLGIALGIWYGFLRPLRPRHTALSDFLFLPAAFYAWLALGFGVCRGDLRLGCCSGLFLGAVAWQLSFGRLLAPVFAWFWNILSIFWQGLCFPFLRAAKKLGIF